MIEKLLIVTCSWVVLISASWSAVRSICSSCSKQLYSVAVPSLLNQMEPAAVVIDNGTGYTKMGYAGNMEPSYMIPSVIATAKTNVS